MTQETIGSKGLETFLRYLMDVKSEHESALDIQRETDDLTQDILHSIEMDDNSYHQNGKLVRTLGAVRRKRREAKNLDMVIDPLIGWIYSNQPTIKALEKVLGEMRKAERVNGLRTYHPKTDIVKRTLKEENHGKSV